MATITVPDDLVARISAVEEDVNLFAVAALREKVEQREAAARAMTIRDLVRSGWTPPTVHGKPRPDGRPWSEVEAAADPA